jgi:hypothetical protein
VGASAVIVYEKNLFRTRAAFELLVITEITDGDKRDCKYDCADPHRELNSHSKALGRAIRRRGTIPEMKPVPGVDSHFGVLCRLHTAGQLLRASSLLALFVKPGMANGCPARPVAQVLLTILSSSEGEVTAEELMLFGNRNRFIRRLECDNKVLSGICRNHRK